MSHLKLVSRTCRSIFALPPKPALARLDLRRHGQSINGLPCLPSPSVRTHAGRHGNTLPAHAKPTQPRGVAQHRLRQPGTLRQTIPRAMRWYYLLPKDAPDTDVGSTGRPIEGTARGPCLDI